MKIVLPKVFLRRKKKKTSPQFKNDECLWYRCRSVCNGGCEGTREADDNDTQCAHKPSRCPASESSFQSEYLSLTDANNIENACVVSLAFHIISCIPADKLKNRNSSTKLDTTLSQTSSKFSSIIRFSHGLNWRFKVLYKTKTLFNGRFAAPNVLQQSSVTTTPERGQQCWQLSAARTTRRFFSLSHLPPETPGALPAERRSNQVFRWIQNKPGTCGLVPSLQGQSCAVRQLAAFLIFNERLVRLTHASSGSPEPHERRGPRYNYSLDLIINTRKTSSVWHSLSIPEPGIRFKTDMISPNQRCFPKGCFVLSQKKRCTIASLLKPWTVKWLEDKNATIGRSTDPQSTPAPR